MSQRGRSKKDAARADPTAGGKRAGPLSIAEEPTAFVGAGRAQPARDIDAVAVELDLDTGSDAAEATAPDGLLARGVAAIEATVKTLPATPGVYRMIDAKGEALYVGKARNLKRRVMAYTQISRLPLRLTRMVAETAQMEVAQTHTEAEALLLESNLIKRLMPRYNVLLRDDKSFPYLLLASDHAFPQIVKHRGAQDRPGDYFGPFASAGAVNRTVTALEKAFLLRSCSDAVFAQRSRPCLMYQIKRCSAPCVGYVDAPRYAELVEESKAFLTGRSSGIQDRLASTMQEAAEKLDFETAAALRDRIRALTQIQSHQDINVEEIEDADVFALAEAGGQTCVEVFFFRGGRNYGNRAYFPRHDKSEATADVLSAFLIQFYENKPVPPVILVSEAPAEQALLTEALSLTAKRRLQLLVPQRGGKRRLVERARDNAREALARRLSETGSQRRLLGQLAERLDLEAPPERIEVYDNSHTRGGEPYGAFVVAGPEGWVKAAYRKFRIKGEIEAGDDYAMLREVLTRRFTRALKEDPERQSGDWPDLLIIDGGRGQLTAAEEALAELGLADQPVIAVAKGPDRDAGRERIFQPGRQPIMLPPRDPLLYFIQRLRDEAHRFVIGSHRLGRTKARLSSPLDDVPGIGAKRKKALLLHFGSAKAVARAGVGDLTAVEGISKSTAETIYRHFHEGEG